MPKARRSIGVCAEPGCPEDATDNGRCAKHRKLVVGTGSRGSTRQWRKTRERILKRDGHQCTERLDNGERCPIKTNLHVDHIERVTDGGSDEDENLRTLCAFHNLKKG